MAEIKSARADSFIDKPDPAFRTFLFYGPDAGLVSERADRLCAGLGIDASDPFSLVRMDADTAAADKARLSDEAGTIGMFGSSRLIRVSGTTRRNLADAVKPVLDHPPQDCRIVIEAGDLKKDSALRRAVERAQNAAAIGCYPDDDPALDRLITAELGSAGLSIDDDARQFLRSQLGSDRRASRNELVKLALYCHGRRTVSLQDVRDVAGDVSVLAIEDAIDTMANGEVDALEILLRRLAESGAAADMVLLAGLRHFQQLQLSRHRVDANQGTPSQIAATLRPPLHYKRRDKFVRALGLWRSNAITRALARLERAAYEARANPSLSQSLAGTAFVALAVEARNARRSR